MTLTATLPPQRCSRIAAAVHHLLTMSMSTTLSRKTPVPSPEAVALRANRAAACIQLDEIAQHAGLKATDLYMFEIGRGDISADDYDRACVAIQEISDRAVASVGETPDPDNEDVRESSASPWTGLERQEDDQTQQKDETGDTTTTRGETLPEGRRLRAAREAAGVSRIRVARRTGIPSGALAAHEASARPLPPGEFERISEAIAALAAIANSRTPKVGEGADVDADDDAEAEAPSVASEGHPPAELPTVGENHALKARPWLWWGRVQKGLTLEEFAKLLGVPWKVLDAQERGARVMRIDQVEEAAALLGVPLQVALGEVDPQSPLDGDGMDLQEAMVRWHRPVANDEAAPEEAVLRSLAVPVRERMIATRKSLGWGQTEAARRMGFQTSAQLCLIEGGSRKITLEHVARAARAYRTSTDFLLGLRADPDGVSAKDRIVERVGELMQVAVNEMAGAVERHEAVVGGPTVLTVRELVARGQAFLDALARFTHINNEMFVEMRAGASLERAAEDFGTVMLRAKRAVVLHEAAETQMRDAMQAALRTVGEAANDAA